MCSKSPKVVWSTPGSSGPNPVRYFALLAVSETLPYERPWKDCSIAITYWRPVANRASFSAPSTASVPEFVRKLRALPENGAMRSSSSHTSE